MVKLLKTSVTWTAPPTLKRSVEVPLKTTFTGQWVSGKVLSVRKRVKSGLAEDGNAAIWKRGNALQLVMYCFLYTGHKVGCFSELTTPTGPVVSNSFMTTHVCVSECFQQVSEKIHSSSGITCKINDVTIFQNN